MQVHEFAPTLCKHTTNLTVNYAYLDRLARERGQKGSAKEFNNKPASFPSSLAISSARWHIEAMPKKYGHPEFVSGKAQLNFAVLTLLECSQLMPKVEQGWTMKWLW